MDSTGCAVLKNTLSKSGNILFIDSNIELNKNRTSFDNFLFKNSKNADGLVKKKRFLQFIGKVLWMTEYVRNDLQCFVLGLFTK